MSFDLTDYCRNADLQHLFNRLRTCCLGAAGLAKHASTHAHLKTANAVDCMIGGKLYTKAAVADIDPSGAGAIANGYTNLLLVYSDSSGTVSFGLGTAVANGDSTGPVLPEPSTTKALIGAAKIKNDTGSVFTIGTTALNAANVTVTYYDLGFVFENEAL